MQPKLHYYIDGYNLLFRGSDVSESLSLHRERLIQRLNTIVKLLELDITIVFDGQYQADDSLPSHFGTIAVIFSAYGQTADDCILMHVQASMHPKRIVVVTSDKKLAWFARRCDAITESVEFFAKWLTKRYKNKLANLKKNKNVLPIPKTKKVNKQKAERGTTAEENFDFYLNEFEKRFEALPEVIMEEKPKQEVKKAKKVPKKSSSLSDKRRWLEAFERQLEDDSNKH